MGRYCYGQSTRLKVLLRSDSRSLRVDNRPLLQLQHQAAFVTETTNSWSCGFMRLALRMHAQLALLAGASLAGCACATMGPLLTDTTNLVTSFAGYCISTPGESNANCTDLGVTVSPDACAHVCDMDGQCSGITWHGPTTGDWAGHCVIRKDGIWGPSALGDHVSSNKTAGWLPGAIPWGPATQGYTPRVKPFWFGANASGLDSTATLQLLGAHAVAGYGWQTGHEGGGKPYMGEDYQSSATAWLQSYLSSVGNPNGTTVFQYRQIQVALRLFAASGGAADDPSLAGFWLKDPKGSGSVCTAHQPWGTDDPYWDFTNSSAIDYWVDSVIGGLTSDGSLTGGNGAVFFDECDQGQCGYRGGSCDFGSVNATAAQLAYLAMFPRMVGALNSAGIVPILSLDNRLASSGDGLPGAPAPCALPEDALVAALGNHTWVRFYENWPGTFWAPSGPDTDAAMVANALLEGAAGIPTVLHSPTGSCPAPDRNITRPGPLGGDIEFAVASYLVVQSPGTTLSISTGWYDANFCWRPEFNVEYGLPVGPAVRTGTHAWARNYTRVQVTLDVSAGRTGSVYLLA